MKGVVASATGKIGLPAVAFTEHADFTPGSRRAGQKAAMAGSVVFGCCVG